ncbi:MAG: 3-oxoacyl-[acyl-carrier-protein] reductase [Actinomycetia bacterium]|nr:3-oxoacyl-[acyl-carrier-protein] reductase [Actinomycetes bacterium]
MAELKNKVALVTGGARGIGEAICRKLARMGADIGINYNFSSEKAVNLKNEIEKIGRRAIVLKADVSSFSEANEMVEEIMSSFQRIDILVNNAGINRDNLIMRMTENEWDDVININLKGTFNCIKAVSRIMLKQRSGSIINISSVIGISGNPGQSNYSASKAGIIGLTKSLSKEFAKRGVRVNSVAPGFIETDMTKRIPEEVKNVALRKIALQRFGKPEEVADIVGFLASDNSSYITGEVIKIDGDMSL